MPTFKINTEDGDTIRYGWNKMLGFFATQFHGCTDDIISRVHGPDEVFDLLADHNLIFDIPIAHFQDIDKGNTPAFVY